MPFSRSGSGVTAKVLSCVYVLEFTIKCFRLEKSGKKYACDMCNFFAPICHFIKRWVIFPQTKKWSDGPAIQTRLESGGVAKTLWKSWLPTGREADCSCWKVDKAAFTLYKVPVGWQMLWHIQRNKRSSLDPYNSIGRRRYPAWVAFDKPDQ